MDRLPDDVLNIIIDQLEAARDVSSLALTSRNLAAQVARCGWRTFVARRFVGRTGLASLGLAREEYSAAANPGTTTETKTKTTTDWAHVAECLTFEERCWSRRAIQFRRVDADVDATEEFDFLGGGAGTGGSSNDGSSTTRGQHQQQNSHSHHHHQRHARWNGPTIGRQTVRMVPHVAVGLDAGGSGKRVVVWGAGPDIAARMFTATHRAGTTSRRGIMAGWPPADTVALHFDGAAMGFRAGADDVTALTMCAPPATMTTGRQSSSSSSPPHQQFLAVGRASGSMWIHSMARASFGQPLFELRGGDTEWAAGREVRAMDHHVRSGGGYVIASGTKGSGMRVHTIPAGDDGEHDQQFSALTPGWTEGCTTLSRPPPVRAMKFLDENTLVVGLTADESPLRLLVLNETGQLTELVNPRHNGWQTAPDYDMATERRTVRAIETLCAGSGEIQAGNLILSAWEDGAIRLTDVRTRSAFDATYTDVGDPQTPANALLSFGPSHFVAGCSRQTQVKLFDLRWWSPVEFSELQLPEMVVKGAKGGSDPGETIAGEKIPVLPARFRRAYRYTDGLSCSAAAAHPHPSSRGPLVNRARASCSDDDGSGMRCLFHDSSRAAHYARPDATVLLRYHHRADWAMAVYGGDGGRWSAVGGARGGGPRARRSRSSGGVPQARTRVVPENHSPVYSLARAGAAGYDGTGDFYIGVSGAVLEARLGSFAEDLGGAQTTAATATAPAEWEHATVRVERMHRDDADRDPAAVDATVLEGGAGWRPHYAFAVPGHDHRHHHAPAAPAASDRTVKLRVQLQPPRGGGGPRAVLPSMARQNWAYHEGGVGSVGDGMRAGAVTVPWTHAGVDRWMGRQGWVETALREWEAHHRLDPALHMPEDLGSMPLSVLVPRRVNAEEAEVAQGN